ncbi:tag-18 [Pristionchus pacificus]|uniref:Tag-18 n=1 Tax=Pristionchus pacificus TaxID=54126 RepID=A0A2A6BDI6_PRIPA|nr:tag-18 [Pristionchus pacificus]|eukprot:PDM63947.1 tag-18 [Pristionchus pacificus]
MERGGPMVRARSSVCLPRSRSVERFGKVGTLTRVSSVPSLDSLRVTNDRYPCSTMYKYRRNYDLMAEWESDRANYYTPLYWPTYRYAARRYAYTDPIPHSLGFETPSFWSRYKWYTDWLNPTYWRRHRDPNYDRPLWNNWRPWQLDKVNVKRAIDMYRNGLIDFKTLDKKWIEPTALGRRGKDWNDVYIPAARYGAHRYFHSWDR